MQSERDTIIALSKVIAEQAMKLETAETVARSQVVKFESSSHANCKSAQLIQSATSLLKKYLDSPGTEPESLVREALRQLSSVRIEL